MTTPDETRDHTNASMLNVGCGTRWHWAWCNIDLVSTQPEVIQHDIREGLPFEMNSFQVVYHSHVLEHLDPAAGERLVRECFRVLNPGGVLRIVVPDLERIAHLYLSMLRKAWDGDSAARENYEWMKLELLDQLVRSKSGGQMGPYMIDASRKNADFVKSRIGDEINSCQSSSSNKATASHVSFGARFKSWRESFSLRLVGWLLGRDQSQALQEALFRQQGEIHRWMYDRLSLKQLCQRCGFEDFQVCQAMESSVDECPSFCLDAVNGSVRNPASLFIECRKPLAGSQARPKRTRAA